MSSTKASAVRENAVVSASPEDGDMIRLPPLGGLFVDIVSLDVL